MSLYTTPIININLKKITTNYLTLKNLCQGATPSAVIKDDAYGLGAIEVSKVLYDAGCRDFFVAHAKEGSIVRPYLKDANIYVLQGIGQDSLPYFIDHNLIPVICSLEMFSYFKQTPLYQKTSPIIQVETGLNRLGFSFSDLEKLSPSELNSFSYVLSHLSCADTPAHFMNEHQLNNFIKIKNRFFPNTKATLSASDGIFISSDYHFNMVRLGAAIYGINTAPYRPNTMLNVIEVKAPILQIKEASKGEYIGYSATYKCLQNTKIAIVSIGYGDGISRSLSNRGKVIFYTSDNKPHFCPIIGRVSMDNIICDVTSIDEIHPGDFAYIINDDYTLDDIARDSDTIAYEVISNIGKNPRFIKNYIK